MRFICRIFNGIKNRIKSCYYRMVLKDMGRSSVIISPLHLDGKENISVGNNVLIQYKTWLAAKPLTGEPEATLKIGDGSVIGHFNHIYATRSIIIEDNVLTADKVYISDNIHSYKNINIPVLHQPVEQRRDVVIGAGSWLGENVCVIGARIGRNCVIGANSVVTKDIPDYCVAVGAPAKVIKRYNEKNREWENF